MKISENKISFQNIKIKDKNIFNNMARTYFKELDRKFSLRSYGNSKPRGNWLFSF